MPNNTALQKRRKHDNFKLSEYNFNVDINHNIYPIFQ